MGMEVDQRAVSLGRFGQHGVDAPMVLSGESGIDSGEVARVVAKCRVVDVANEDGPDREIAQESLQSRCERLHPRTIIDEEAAQQVVAPDSQDRYAPRYRLKPACLSQQAVNGCAISCSMLEVHQPA
jgi:hypothetical protein